MGRCIMRISELLQHVMNGADPGVNSAGSWDEGTVSALQSYLEDKLFAQVLLYRDRGIDSYIRIRSEDVMELYDILNDRL